MNNKSGSQRSYLVSLRTQRQLTQSEVHKYLSKYTNYDYTKFEYGILGKNKHFWTVFFNLSVLFGIDIYSLIIAEYQYWLKIFLSGIEESCPRSYLRRLREDHGTAEKDIVKFFKPKSKYYDIENGKSFSHSAFIIIYYLVGLYNISEYILLLGEINYQLGLNYNNTDELEAEQEMKISMLKRLFQERDISQSDLAKMLGVSRQRVNNFLSGKHIVYSDFGSRVQKALDLPSDYFSQYRSSLNQQKINTVQEFSEPEPAFDIEKLRNDLARIKREHNLSNRAIFRASGVHFVTVSKLLSGKTKTVRTNTYNALVKYIKSLESEEK